MAEFHFSTEAHERSYLKGELESLGLSSINIDRLTNDSNDNSELRSLVKTTKDCLLQEFKKAHKSRD